MNHASDIVEHVHELLARGAADSAVASVSYVGESEVYGLLDEIAKLRRALAKAEGEPARDVTLPDDAWPVIIELLESVASGKQCARSMAGQPCAEHREGLAEVVKLRAWAEAIRACRTEASEHA